jgi:hypothetical protein
MHKPGPVVILGPNKKPERCRDKVARDYGGDWSQLHDAVRATIGVDKLSDVAGAWKTMAKHMREKGFVPAKRPKNRFESPVDVGYRDILSVWRSPEGLCVEVQVNVKEMLLAKERQHPNYEKQSTIERKVKDENRAMTPEEKSVVAEMIRLQREDYMPTWDRVVKADSKPE